MHEHLSSDLACLDFCTFIKSNPSHCISQLQRTTTVSETLSRRPLVPSFSQLVRSISLHRRQTQSIHHLSPPFSSFSISLHKKKDIKLLMAEKQRGYTSLRG
ncbi:unnamed protein product [Trifolium pratense]|uniref:Uncharacterized protein n=1 Tax=Trifolium pratense TaxID=57577 RepID=A0ACB0JHI5_TRIPR|nr:unnamed protein product [Trifolium pratense]